MSDPTPKARPLSGQLLSLAPPPVLVGGSDTGVAGADSGESEGSFVPDGSNEKVGDDVPEGDRESSSEGRNDGLTDVVSMGTPVMEGSYVKVGGTVAGVGTIVTEGIWTEGD